MLCARVCGLGGEGCAHNRRLRRTTTPRASEASRTANRQIEVQENQKKPSALVVGGGWAGFGAAWRLLQMGFEVQLVDAAENPGGLSTGWRTKSGRAVEAGIKGFWYHYQNIDKLVEELRLPQSPFTEYTSSAFWDTTGIQVTAPIFQSLPRLPTPLGNFVYTAPNFTNLPLEDRLTAAPLIQALLEFDADEECFSEYDKMSARELFMGAGVSKGLYSKFLEPILLALLFVPLEQLSAATALAVLYNYVLAHQADFDVRWVRGSVAELIFQPWIARMKSLGGEVSGGWRVQEVLLDEQPGRGPLTRGVRAQRSDGQVQDFTADVTVMAVGVKALQGISRSTPRLSQLDIFRRVNNFDAVSVLAVRIWFNRRVVIPSKSNVFGGIDPGVGGTFFDLNSLQDEYRDEPGSVVEVDLYNAAAFMGMSDTDILQEVQQRYLGKFVPALRSAEVVDYVVIKVPQGVTKFCPGSYQWMTETTTPVWGLFLAGDHIKHGPGAHGARGLSQEKALVTGYLAAAAGARHLGVSVPANVLPIDVEKDEAHMQLGKELARAAIVARRSFFPSSLR